MLRFALGLLTLSAVAQVPAAISPVPNSDDILKRVESALGWTGKFGTTLSLSIEGTLDGAPIKVSARQPSLFRMDLTAGSDHIVQAYDGSFGWQTVIGEHPQPVTELKGPQLDQLIDQASNAIGGPLVSAAARGTQIEFEGHAQVDGKVCYKLKLTLVSGAVIHEQIDARTYLEQHEEIISASDPKTTVEESVSDYRRFGGILFPCLFVSGPKDGDKTYELRVTAVTINPSLASNLFAMPIANPAGN